MEATGSEPLSLEEEVKIQLSWRDDDDKCTFIVLDRALCSKLCDKGNLNLDDILVTERDYENTNTEVNEKNLTAEDESASAKESNFVTKTLNAMVGDVNLFLSDDDDYDDDDDSNSHEENDSKNKPTKRMAELDVMIAEQDARGKGIGKECACMMMLYATKHIKICKFVVRINEYNVALRKMFEQALGFREVNYAACFQQYEYEFKHETCEAAIEALEKICDANDKIQKWHVPC